MEKGEINPIYEERLIVLVEDIETNVFHQVLLSQDRFKKVSDAICTIEKDESNELREGFEMARIEIGDIEIPSDTFIGMSSITK